MRINPAQWILRGKGEENRDERCNWNEFAGTVGFVVRDIEETKRKFAEFFGVDSGKHTL